MTWCSRAQRSVRARPHSHRAAVPDSGGVRESAVQEVRLRLDERSGVRERARRCVKRRAIRMLADATCSGGRSSRVQHAGRIAAECGAGALCGLPAWTECTLGDFPGNSWSLANASASGRRWTGIAPEYCKTVCTYNFSNSFAAGLLPGRTDSDDFVVFASFVFSGPSVEATATCPSVCPPGGFRNFYATNWADVPITMTGQVDWVSRDDPRVVFHYIIAGSGTARAETRLYQQDPGP